MPTVVQPSTEELDFLQAVALQTRRDILTAIYHADKSGHPGGSFSIVEAVVDTYFGKLADGSPLVRVNPANPDDAARDLFVLGCGHNATALYAVLARMGFFDIASVHEGYRKVDGLPGHPKISVHGVETNEGSLGQALPKAVGLADILLRDHRQGKQRPDGTVRRVVVLDGDGSFEEGSVKEALANAAKRELGNLVYVISANAFGLDGEAQHAYRKLLQAYGFTVLGKELERKTGERSIATKCADASRLFLDERTDIAINGNDMQAVLRTFDYARYLIDDKRDPRPKAVILNTIKGAGHRKMAGSNVFHAKVPALALEEAIAGICIPGSEDEGGEPQYARATSPRIVSSGKQLGRVLVHLASDHDFTVISADTGTSTGAIEMLAVDPTRYIDVGCAEQQLVSEAEAHALLAKNVIAVTFGGFLTSRAREQIVSLAQLYALRQPRSSTILLGTHTGLSAGKDDMSHHGVTIYDLANLPHLTLMEAADHEQAAVMLQYALQHPGLYYVAVAKEAEILHRRMHESVATNVRMLDGRIKTAWRKLEQERGLPTKLNPARLTAPVIQYGSPIGADGLIITTGLRTYDAIDAARIAAEKYQVHLAVVQLPTVQPYHAGELATLLDRNSGRVTIVEEHLRGSGIGQRIMAFMQEHGFDNKVTHLCLDDFGASDSYNVLLEMNGLDTASIARAAAGNRAKTRTQRVRDALHVPALASAVIGLPMAFFASLGLLLDGDPAALRGCKREHTMGVSVAYHCSTERDYDVSFPDRLERHPNGTVSYVLDLTPPVP